MKNTTRNATGSDIPYLYDICLKTGVAGINGTDFYYDSLLPGHYFAAPYLWRDSSLCFVTLDEKGKPGGYIVGTDDTPAFNHWMNEYWLPSLRIMYGADYKPKSSYGENLVNLIQKGPKSEIWEQSGYKAHLHIHILPELQGKGSGHILMERFLSELRARNVDGVHFAVEGMNYRAFQFYERMGFSILEQTEWGTFFGMKLS